MLAFLLMDTLSMIIQRRKRSSNARNARIGRMFGGSDPWRPAHKLGPLKLVQTLDGDEFVDFLNRREDTPEADFVRKNLPDFAPQLPVVEILRTYP